MGSHGDPPHVQSDGMHTTGLTVRKEGKKQIISLFSMHDGTPAEIILAD